MGFRIVWLLLVIGLASTSLPGSTAAQSSTTLAQALEILKADLATEAGKARAGAALAAEVSPEGHWTFANAAGERFTTASPEELKRVLPTLAADAAKPGARLLLLVTEDTVFKQRQHFQALPMAGERRTELRIAVDGKAYPLVRQGERASGQGSGQGSERHYAEVRSNLLIELTERRLFDEAVWQLAHPLKRASIRILALEPGGPEAVSPSPRLDPQTKHALTDQVAPVRLDRRARYAGAPDRAADRAP